MLLAVGANNCRCKCCKRPLGAVPLVLCCCHCVFGECLQVLPLDSHTVTFAPVHLRLQAPSIDVAVTMMTPSATAAPAPLPQMRSAARARSASRPRATQLAQQLVRCLLRIHDNHMCGTCNRTFCRFSCSCMLRSSTGGWSQVRSATAEQRS